MTIQTMTLGYVRMDIALCALAKYSCVLKVIAHRSKCREVKKALESFWNGMADAETLLATVYEIEAHGWKTKPHPDPHLHVLQRIWRHHPGHLWGEVIPVLKNMAATAQQLREGRHAT